MTVDPVIRLANAGTWTYGRFHQRKRAGTATTAPPMDTEV